MMCVGDNEIKPPIYGILIEKNKCMRTDIRFENGLMYLYPALHSNETLACTTYKKEKKKSLEINGPSLHM